MGKVYISCTDKEWSDMEDGKINIIDYKGTEYVRVVRCKDCRKWCICHHSDDYYCADGERRE